MSVLVDLYNRAWVGPWVNGAEDTQWKTERVSGVTYLSFQYTASDRDWKDNFSAFVVPYKNQPVKWYAHEGFTRKYKAVRDSILADIQGDQFIVILGISQGAALATLALEDIKFTYPYKSVSCHAFASPRVVSWLSGDIWDRFENLHIHNCRRDIVGHVPLVAMGYRHVKPVEYIGPAGFLTTKYHYPEPYRKYL